MSLVAKLSSLALRPVLNRVIGAILPGVELGGYSEEAANAAERFFVSRFTDPSKQLRSALSQAVDRSWRAVEIALTGESFWSWLTDRGEDKAFRADIRTFLDSNPLQLPPGRDETFRRAALEQLRAARKTGLLPGKEPSATTTAKQTTDFLRFTAPRAVCEAEWRVMGEIAGTLREYRHAALADLVELRPVANQPPLLAVAVRFFFRREVETKPELFQGLVYDQVDQLGQALEAGLGRFHDALQNHGERLLEILALTEAIHADVLNLKTEQAKLGDGFREFYSAVSSLGEKLDRLHERNLRQTDATSIRGGTERQLVKAVKARFRTLSDSQRQEVPALLNAIGKLEMAAGNYEEAHQDFRQVASMVSDQAGKAAANHNAFLAALEKKDWTTALTELVEASRLDPDRFSLFPLDRYEPERILGAGGFGIVFLCRNRLSKARLVVKALRSDELDRDLSAVLEEAGALEQLHHEAIIRLRDCGCADANQTRPYLVMDYFDGVTLDEFIKKHGQLAAQEARVLARQMAEGLSAAHVKGILHRDVKPGNVLVERASSGLHIKLIDFGLAMRQQAVHNTISNASALSNTIRGQSIAGTLDYASPEQMGKLPGEAVSPRSDVYGYGRTLCFALFGTPKPGPRHWKELQDEPFGDLIGTCIEEDPKRRPNGFQVVLDHLQPQTPTESNITAATGGGINQEEDRQEALVPIELSQGSLVAESDKADKEAVSDRLSTSIEKLDGELSADGKGLTLMTGNALDNLREIAELCADRVTSIFINTDEARDKHIKHLRKFRKLKKLTIVLANKLTDEALEYINELSSLRKLELPMNNKRFTLGSMLGLADLSELEVLGLPSVWRVGLRELKEDAQDLKDALRDALPDLKIK